MVSFLQDQMDATEDGQVSAVEPLKQLKSEDTGEPQTTTNGQAADEEEEEEEDDEPQIEDEEQLRRILMCKRLSEGCNRMQVALGGGGGALFGRKNSMHLIGEELAPVTEGVPMRHMSMHTSNQNVVVESTSSSSRFKFAAGGSLSKRNSQDDGTSGASCSSSTSLDGVGLACGAQLPSERSASGSSSSGRRRSSTVSQCSSVLSEGTRQQLNFELSPDLPPDSSLLDANAVSPTEFELDSSEQRRPASPEPLLSSSNSSFELLRPTSRLSTGDELEDNMFPAAAAAAAAVSPEAPQDQLEARSGTNRQLVDGIKLVSENIERLSRNVSSACKVSNPNLD